MNSGIPPFAMLSPIGVIRDGNGKTFFAQSVRSTTPTPGPSPSGNEARYFANFVLRSIGLVLALGNLLDRPSKKSFKQRKSRKRERERNRERERKRERKGEL